MNDEQIDYYLFLKFLETNSTIKNYFYQFGDNKYRDGVFTGFGLGLIFCFSTMAFKRYLGIPALI